MDEAAAKARMDKALRVAEQEGRQWLSERLLNDDCSPQDIVKAMLGDLLLLHGTGDNDPVGILDRDAMPLALGTDEPPAEQ